MTHTKLKKVGITQRLVSAEKGAARDALEQDYVQYYQSLGFSLIPISSALTDIPNYLDSLDLEGFILSEGNDVNPSLYGGTQTAGVKYADERDRTEYAILNYAIEKNIPVICQCRGTQLLNVFFGGKLTDIKSVPGATNHVATRHEVHLREKVIEHLNTTKFDVNSYHNQGFTEPMVSKDLRIFAIAPDGIVEGIYHPQKRIAGILWHPEREQSPHKYNDKLVNAFVHGELFWK